MKCAYLYCWFALRRYNGTCNGKICALVLNFSFWHGYFLLWIQQHLPFVDNYVLTRILFGSYDPLVLIWIILPFTFYVINIFYQLFGYNFIRWAHASFMFKDVRLDVLIWEQCDISHTLFEPSLFPHSTADFMWRHRRMRPVAVRFVLFCLKNLKFPVVATFHICIAASVIRYSYKH
jgi:hypothetical protein